MKPYAGLILKTLMVLLVIMIVGCTNSGVAGENSRKGAKTGMQTHYIGRFSIDVPAEMHEAARGQELRYADLHEFEWPKNLDREKARKAEWEKRLAEIREIYLPRGIKKAIIAEKKINAKYWNAAVIYYGDHMDPENHHWNVLVDTGNHGLWLKIDGLDNDMTEANLTQIINSIAPVSGSKDRQAAFSLKNHVVRLPYLEKESTYVRYEGHPLDLRLEVDMKETYAVETTTLTERLAAAVSSNFVPGVDVTTVRMRKRTVAGLQGEEVVLRLKDDDGVELHFGWEYHGKEDSGEYPFIQVEMETPGGKVDEKLKIWDAALDSMRPTYR